MNTKNYKKRREYKDGELVMEITLSDWNMLSYAAEKYERIVSVNGKAEFIQNLWSRSPHSHTKRGWFLETLTMDGIEVGFIETAASSVPGPNGKMIERWRQIAIYQDADYEYEEL